MVTIRMDKNIEEIDNFTSSREKLMLEKGFHKATNPEGYLPMDLKQFKKLMNDMIYPLQECTECGNRYLVIRYFYRRGQFIPHYCCTKCNTSFEINNGGTLQGKKLK